MKKLLSTILCLAMMLSLATPALAASSTTASGIRGEIIYQEGGNSLSRSSPTVIVSSVKNQDGSYTICQYSNGVLQEEHTTVPGSGFVSSKIYNADGSVSPSQKLLVKAPSPLQQLAEAQVLVPLVTCIIAIPLHRRFSLSTAPLPTNSISMNLSPSMLTPHGLFLN